MKCSPNIRLFKTLLRSLPMASLLCLFSSAPSQGRPLFQVDFHTANINNFVNPATPGRGQFTDVSAKVGGGSWSLVDTDPDPQLTEYALQLVRTGSSPGAGISRSINLEPTSPGIVCIRFDMAVNHTVSADRTNALTVEVGNLANTGTDYNLDVPPDDAFGRLFVDLKSDGTFKLKLSGTSQNSFGWALDTTKCPANGTVATISYYLNKSGTGQYYRAPNGVYSFLNHGRCTAWIEWDEIVDDTPVHRVHQAVLATTTAPGVNSHLNNFRLRCSTADSATWRFDNFRVENVLVPTMYGFPAERLVEAKARIAAGDPTVMPAFNQLVSEAQAVDTQAEFPARSVTDKATSAYFPEGTEVDERDYVSVGVYWWPPDASNPDGWYQDDGHPNYDNAENTHMGDFAAVCDAVVTLCWAYYLTPATSENTTTRAGYVQQVSTLMYTWFLSSTTGMNPHLQYAGVVPFHEQYGLGSTAGIIDGGRLIEVSDAIALIADSSHWHSSRQNAWEQWIKDYRAWLLEPEGRGSVLMGLAISGSNNNNHTTWCDAQVAQYSLIVGDYRTARNKIKDAHLTNRLPYQSGTNGAQRWELERPASLDYSAYNAIAMLTLANQAAYFNYNWTLQTVSPASPLGGRSLRKVMDFFASYADVRPSSAASNKNWQVMDPGSIRNQGERFGPRWAVALGASIWHGTTSYPAYWANITPLLGTGASYTHTYNSVTTTYYYANERWNLFLPPAP